MTELQKSMHVSSQGLTDYETCKEYCLKTFGVDIGKIFGVSDEKPTQLLEV